MLKKLDLAALAAIDGGRIKVAFDNALHELQHDCKDRPALKAPRKLVLTVVMRPEPDDAGGDLESCDVAFEVKTAIPKRSSKIYNMRASALGALVFNELSPDDARQGTLPIDRDRNAGGESDDDKNESKAGASAPAKTKEKR